MNTNTELFIFAVRSYGSTVMNYTEAENSGSETKRIRASAREKKAIKHLFHVVFGRDPDRVELEQMFVG